MLVPDFKFRELKTNGTGQRRSGYFVNLGSQNEVALCQAVDLMSPDLDSGLSPAQENIGVMTLLLGNSPSLVYKIECSPKITPEISSQKEEEPYQKDEGIEKMV